MLQPFWYSKETVKRNILSENHPRIIQVHPGKNHVEISAGCATFETHCKGETRVYGYICNLLAHLGGL